MDNVIPIENLLPSYAIDLDDYLGKLGLRDPASGWCLDKLRSNRQLSSQRGRKRFMKNAEIAENVYQRKRNRAIREYERLVRDGELRPLTKIERSLITARGHEDLKATHAARRILAKRGYDWKTGEKL